MMNKRQCVMDDFPFGGLKGASFISSTLTQPLRLEVLWQHKNSLDECSLDIDD